MSSSNQSGSGGDPGQEVTKRKRKPCTTKEQERKRAAWRDYYHRNKEKCAASTKKSRSNRSPEQKEAQRERSRRHRERNRDKLNQYQREYLANNPEQKQRAAEYGKQRRKAFKEAGLCISCGRDRSGNCQYCGTCWVSRRISETLTGCEDRRAAKDILWRKWESQNGRCKFTGLPLTPGLDCSLDHSKPQSRYPELAADPHNIDFVHDYVNRMKHNMTDDEFVALCRVVVARADGEDVVPEFELPLMKRWVSKADG